MTYLPPGDPKRRIRRIRAFVVIVAVLFGVRLVDLQIVESDAINAKSYANRAVSRVLPSLRGEITDNANNVLAYTVFKYDVNAAPDIVAPFNRTVNGQKTTVSVEQAATEIAALVGQTQPEVLAKLIGTGKYSQVAKAVEATVYRQVKKLDIPWLFYDPRPARVYPNGAVAGGILGFLDPDGKPLEGIEIAQNSCLAGKDGEETYEKGVDGIKIPSSAITTKAAVPGKKIVLTINSDLQYFAQQVLTANVAKLRADWGTAVVIEVKTGKILVAADAPSYDPNEPGKSSVDNRGSRVFRTSFEPGSTMKMVTAATAIDQGKVTPETHFVAPFAMTIPHSNGYRVTDSHQHGNDKLTVAGVLRDSSNTGAMQIGNLVPWQTRRSYMERFGVGSMAGSGFPGESAGLINTKTTWANDVIKRYVSTFGQGVSVTPLQSAMMYQAVANKGIRLQPKLIEGCVDASGNMTKVTKDKAPVRVVTEATAKSTLDILEKVVEEGGIGKHAAVPGYRVGGKTGTAQITDPNTGRYGNLHAISFIGVAPIDDPQYVVAVTAYKSRTVSNSLGATPIFKAIMSQVLRTYRVPPSTTKSANIKTTW
ncbi:MAG: peptidoglycan D,D-transpeptidase FtsI family protein [Rhodoluna sp.]